MRSTQQFSITLPNEMAEAVRAKVSAGEYATESEVIREGLRVLLARDRAVEDWLEPAIHEIKVQRSDLLGELRRPAKSAAYRALCGQCWFVIKAGIAEPDEIPPEYGVLIGHAGHLELARPAPKRAHKPDFATWMALARATPLLPPDDDPQSPL